MRTIISLILVWFLTGSLAGQEIDLEKDLVALYLFEGNASNSVNDRNHGIETNVEYENDRMGNPNSSIFFTGNSSYVTIPHTEELNWDARSDSYSILFWVKSPDPTNGGEIGSRILSKWDEVLWDPYPFSIQYSDQILGVNIFEANSQSLSCKITGIWNDQWHHVAMVYMHESNLLSVYIDGVFDCSKSQTFNSTTLNSTDIYIGRTLTQVLEGFYNGFFDDLYFYNRAINECEIEALYSGQLLEER